jgi:hypothetical protein
MVQALSAESKRFWKTYNRQSRIGREYGIFDVYLDGCHLYDWQVKRVLPPIYFYNHPVRAPLFSRVDLDPFLIKENGVKNVGFHALSAG